MATNASVFNITQIGPETVYGTAVAATRLLSAMGIDVRPQGESNVFRPEGQKFDVVVAPNKLWTTGAIAGAPCYTELQIPLASIFEGSVVTAAGVSTWTFISRAGAPDAVKSFTVERGSAIAGQSTRFTNGLVRSLTLGFARNGGISMGGEFFGRAIERGITLTSALTGLPLIPVLARDVNVYADPTLAAIGTTQLLNAMSAEFGCSGKFGPKYVLNRANGLTFDTHVELPPQVTLRLRAEADAVGLGFLDNFEDGSKVFVEIDAQSTLEVVPGTPYSLNIQFAGAVERPEGFPDEEGVKAAEFTLRGLFDGPWANAFKIVLVNAQPAL